MLKSVQSTADKIKSLEVRGARNIAIAATKAIETLARDTRAKNKERFLTELVQAKNILFASRETEPLMRNALRLITSRVEKSKETKVDKLVKIVSLASRRFLEDLEQSKEKIAAIGSKRIKQGSSILTHCHSSTVTYMLQKAKKEGRDFELFCTETRPIFQGRITAEEMLNLNVKTTFIIDSAARFFMNQVDFVVVGADAITSEGNIVNKIGTSIIALAAKEARTPLYIVSELLKFDPVTMYGDYERIEERSHQEIWEHPPKGLLIRNPAFDITKREFIHGIICEAGIISPHSVLEVMHRTYPWIFE